MDVDTVVIGRSVHGTGITTDEYLANLAQAINEIGVEMLVGDEGKVVDQYKP